jgi:predicted acetyltransferase
VDLEIRSIAPEELAELHAVVETSFGGQSKPERVEDERLIIEYDRMIAVVENGSFVGSAGAYTFDLTLPGATTAPVAGVTWVGVLPTHRRRGILSQMMTFQLDDVVARGEPLAVLTASEAVIYGRYGYGVGAQFSAVEIKTRRSEFMTEPEGGGSMRLVSADEAAKLMPAIYDGWRRQRTGAISRNEGVWTYYFKDKEWNRHGWGPQFQVVHQTATGEADGYARYRVKQGEEINQVFVIEVIAIDKEVEAALWRFVLDLDLVVMVEGGRQPVDDSLRWRLRDSRAYDAKGPWDWLWVRLLDVPGALAARRYETRGSLVFEVADRFRPDGEAAGRFRLDGGPDGATCARTTDAPDITLPVEMLGAAYLGGVRFTTLAGASRVAGDADALRRADAMFSSTPLPFCNTPF